MSLIQVYGEGLPMSADGLAVLAPSAQRPSEGVGMMEHNLAAFEMLYWPECATYRDGRHLQTMLLPLERE